MPPIGAICGRVCPAEGKAATAVRRRGGKAERQKEGAAAEGAAVERAAAGWAAAEGR